MGQLLFKLHQVPEDEAEEVRALFGEHGFRTYETHAGFWGMGVSAIWLADGEDLDRARAVLKDYQARRLEHQRALHAERRAEGREPGFWRRAAQSPVRFVAMLLAAGAVLALSTLPFIGLIGRIQ